MTHYTGKKILMKFALVTAVAATILGCGNVTAIAPDGGGGKAGEIVVSTGGEGGEGSAAAAGAPGTGGVVASTGGTAARRPAPAGRLGRLQREASADARDRRHCRFQHRRRACAGGTVVTIDAGTGDASACPRTLKTSDFGQGVEPTTARHPRPGSLRSRARQPAAAPAVPTG